MSTAVHSDFYLRGSFYKHAVSNDKETKWISIDRPGTVPRGTNWGNTREGNIINTFRDEVWEEIGSTKEEDDSKGKLL